MIDFVVLDSAGRYWPWNFENVEHLLREYNSNNYHLPDVDDAVTSFEFHGIPLYVNTFADILNLFGIEWEGE